MRLSKGDIVINKAVALGTNSTQELPEDNLLAKLESSDVDKRKKKFFKKSEIEAEQKQIRSDIKAIIALDKSAVREGGDEYKYTFDTIYEDKQLAQVAKDYYSERTGKDYTEEEAIDKFIADRTWKQANTASIGKEFAYITGSDVSQAQKSRLAYLTQTWSALPNFYEEGGRGFSGFSANLGVALLYK